MFVEIDLKVVQWSYLDTLVMTEKCIKNFLENLKLSDIITLNQKRLKQLKNK